MTDLSGQWLKNRYRVESLLGRGGMAEVYKAWDNIRAIDVAIKVLKSDLAMDAVFLRRFDREAYALAQLDHPHIVRFFGFEKLGSLAFLVMELVEGFTLRYYLSALRRPLTLPETLYVVDPICRALHYAHQKGFYHSDVKPGNIFLERTGRVMLADFGVAHLAESNTTLSLDVGTPAYMSPEQCQGWSLDARSDLYSLGVSVYEMLTLDRPFKGESVTTGSRAKRIQWEHIHLSPPSLRQTVPNIPAETERVVLRALAKDPEQRQIGALAFFNELLASGHGIVASQFPPITDAETAVPTGDTNRNLPDQLAAATGHKPLTVNRGAMITGGIAAVILIVILILSSFKNGPSPSLVPANTQTTLIAGHYAIDRWGAYNLSGLCNSQPFGNLVFTIESVDVMPQKGLRFNVSWLWQVTELEQHNCPSWTPIIWSDAGNARMYIVSDLGDRYDHITVGGGANKNKPMQPNIAEYGWFLFPLPERGEVFTFYDDDNGIVIANIDLHP